MRKQPGVVLITGAAQGLGREMSLSLLEAGWHVAAVDRDLEALARLAADVAGKNDQSKLATMVVDLEDFEPKTLVAQVEARLGAIDVLVNNAAIGQNQIRPDYHVNPPPFYEVTPQLWARALAVNTSATFLLSRAVVPGMLARGWGRVINITTSLGTMLGKGRAPYGPTKAAAEALSAVMAEDLEGTGVTVNVIVPGGLVDTPMIPKEAPFAREALIQPRVMLGPLHWLLSSEANEVTGRRYLGVHWDRSLDPKLAEQQSGAPIGWRDIAVKPITPNVTPQVG
jgi:NAD(P)-dependent dehydrogenase (short-subunit alcohol dehydrogenase family)